jgi:hypothetical protein
LSVDSGLLHLGVTSCAGRLALFGAKERTQREYAELLASAAFRFEQEIDTRAGMSILEARPS